MKDRSVPTRDLLIDATRQVVRDTGYAHATTRAIAKAAGVAEGTIYRHFPDKSALFFAAVAQSHAPVFEQAARLPGRAGQGTVAENLTSYLRSLAGLREEILPLELALLTDPELSRRHRQRAGTDVEEQLTGPPRWLAEYLAAEQQLGRVRADVEPPLVAIVLLATLFGLALMPSPGGAAVDEPMLTAAVSMMLHGVS